MKSMFRELNSFLEFAVFHFPNVSILYPNLIWLLFLICATILHGKLPFALSVLGGFRPGSPVTRRAFVFRALHKSLIQLALILRINWVLLGCSRMTLAISCKAYRKVPLLLLCINWATLPNSCTSCSLSLIMNTLSFFILQIFTPMKWNQKRSRTNHPP
jgi:hypothetical protein